MKTLYANGLPSSPFIYCFLLIVFSLTLTLVQAQTTPYYPPGVKNPSNQTNVNGIWYYTADYYQCDNYHYDGEWCLDFTMGYELWRSNGTASGTIKLKVYANYGSSEYGMPLTFASTFMAVYDYLYFINGEDTDYITLCRIDNSSIEPTIIKTFYISQYRSYFYARMYQSPADYHLTLVNDLLYFTLDDDGDSPIYGTELWKTDGTTAGTLMVKDIRAGGESSAPTDLRSENDLLYFTADDGNGRRLWKSDGTGAGTVKLTQSNSLPAPWTSLDISGTGIAPGSAGYSNGQFILNSVGFDFYKAPDSFHFVNQPFSGNAIIVAKVESIGNTHPNALAGLMIRQDHTPSSSFVAVAVTPSGNINFMWRQGTATPGYKSVPGSAPKWLKLSRNGNVFTASHSTDGSSWTTLGETTITMTNATYVGMALTSQSSQLNRATFSNVAVSTTSSTPTCSASGSILREYWANIAGKEVTAIPVNTAPASTSQLTSFEAPSSAGDTYGQRIRGYICAPATGNYTFYIASDDNSELWLSTSDSPASKRKIASLTGWARNGDWTKYPAQKSATISLEKGKKYYIEALHKEATGGDNLAVAWASPGSSSISIIPGAVLSPVVPTAAACSASGTILREYWANVSGGTVASIPLSTPPTSSTQINSFEAPSSVGDNYGQRIRGYICAPATGSYTFYLASDDQAELWLSSSESPASKQKIAYLTAHTSSRQWTKYASQKSVSISLEKGKKYYIEALHKEAIYGDNLAVGWTLPGSSSIAVIPGSVLSPFVPSAARVAGEENLQPSIAVYPNPFTTRMRVATNGQQGKVLISLTDVVGKTYFEKEYVLSGQSELELELAGVALSSGLHLLRLQTQDGKTHVMKVIKN